MIIINELLVYNSLNIVKTYEKELLQSIKNTNKLKKNKKQKDYFVLYTNHYITSTQKFLVYHIKQFGVHQRYNQKTVRKIF